MLEEVSGRGMLYVAPYNIFFHMCHFFSFCKKMHKIKIAYVHCPIRKFRRQSIEGRLDGTMWESPRIEIAGEGCTSFPRVKPGRCFVCGPYAYSWGVPRVKMKAIRMKIHQHFSSSMTASDCYLHYVVR